MDYTEDIRIDESALDIEWLNQPKLMFTYSELVAKQERWLSKKKEKMEVLKAELDKDIRVNPDKYGIEKITETAVSSTIIKSTTYQEARMEVIDMQYELDIAKAAVRALQDKKSALENLVKLHGSNYFAGPSVPRDLSSEFRKTAEQKKANTAVAGKMRRRTE